MEYIKHMMTRNDKIDLFYANHMSEDCFYMIFRPTDPSHGLFLLDIHGDMDHLQLTSSIDIHNDIITMKDVAYKYESYLDMSYLSQNDLTKESFYESALDVISYMFQGTLRVENTLTDDFSKNNIWSHLHPYIDKYNHYRLKNNISWGNFLTFSQ